MAMTNKSRNCTTEKKLKKYGNFKIIKNISYGVLYKAVEKKNTTNTVAVKEILKEDKEDEDEDEGFPVDGLLEMLALRALRHENLISLINICKHRRGDIMDIYDTNPPAPSNFLIMEYCEYDLATLLSNSNISFSLDEIKIIMKQLLTGVNYMHSKMYIHSNIKPSHILVNKNGIIKLCDFQLVKSIPYISKSPDQYVTRSYLSPELLLGEHKYTSKMDMWSVGCVMAELWTKAPILNGTSNQNQLELISKLCGSITPDVWPNVQNYPFFKKMALPQNLKNQIKETFPQIREDENAIALLENFLTLNPLLRIDAETALNHNFFSVLENPTGLKTMLNALKIE